MSRFIPCQVLHLAHELSEQFPESERLGFWEFARVVEDLYHHFGASDARLLGALYGPYDPDLDIVPTPRVSAPDHLERLFDRLDYLLEAANFDRVGETSLLTPRDREVLRQLHIDANLEAIERLAVYTRGLGTKAIAIRPLRKLFRLEDVELPTFRRVVIVVRTKSEPFVLLKLFKDVPEQDLELLLPTVRVKMKLFDKLKLSGSGGAAALSAWKMLRMAYTYAPTLAKFLAVPFKILLLPVVVLLGGIYGGKTLLDYSKIKASYITVMAEHLYAITLASNRAVLSRLAGMAGEEDTKEVLLAYALLQGEQGLHPAELKQRAEAFLWDRYRCQIEFDVEDALRKLDELAIAWREPDGRRRAVELAAALRNADGSWDELYSPPGPSRAPTRATRRDGNSAAAS